MQSKEIQDSPFFVRRVGMPATITSAEKVAVKYTQSIDHMQPYVHDNTQKED